MHNTGQVMENEQVKLINILIQEIVQHINESIMYTVTLTALCYLCQMCCDLILIISYIKPNKGPRGFGYHSI